METARLHKLRATNRFLRMKAREEGFLRELIPPIPVSPVECDRAVYTPQPRIVKDG